MIAAWMIYITAVAAVIGLAALAMEHGFNALSRQTRWVWAAALVATMALPVYAFLRPAPPDPMAITVVGTAPIANPATALTPASRIFVALEQISGPLGILWVIATACVVIVVAASWWRMRRQAASWAVGSVGGVPVRYSASSGPAVVGCFPGIIVLPRWTRTLDSEWQQMMVAHEEEHLRAQDTGLILSALFLVALLPWCPIAWWMFGRLRHAIELDCDHRVLRRGYDRKAYGNLLIELTQRAIRGPVPAAAFAAPKPLLTRRIRLMMKPTLRRYRWHAVLAAAAAVTLTAIGCELPTPPTEDKSSQSEPEQLTANLHVARELLQEAEGRLERRFGEGPIGDEEREELVGTILRTKRALEEAMAANGGNFEFTASEVGPADEQAVSEAEFGRFRLRAIEETAAGALHSNPQVYVDGVLLEASETAAGLNMPFGISVNPDDIARVEVIKGDVLRAQFGPEATSGVIRITTKNPPHTSGNGN